jgi:RNA polymerase sigma-70 factor (ECF subfamily)
MEQDASRTPLLELTRGLERGDDEAWTRFHREYGPGIFRRLLAATRGDHDLANEALQQTYLRIARHARPCESEPMFEGWLRVVARSALHDCWRRRRSFWQLLQRRHADPSDAPSEEIREDQSLAILEAALSSLDAGDRELLEGKYFSGCDVRSLAEKLAISPKAVESRLTRARAELRRRLIEAFSRHE